MTASLPNDQYTVGWVCALPIEFVAAKAMLDKEHGDPQTQPQKADDNNYVLGTVGRFNVVIACLPKDEIGSSSAATVARDMLFTFPGIRFGLMVGIGAGIPDYELDEAQDVRLGDIVVSSSKENGGVVVYDFGKKLSDGSFKAMYPLNRPPRSLRTALARLEAEHMMSGSQLTTFIEKALDKYPALRRQGWLRPQQDSDRLFQSEYAHVTGRTCAKCEKEREVNREDWKRHDEDPVIHYGTIATGSAVVKHAPTRVDIGKTHQAICLEMEAAGLMNSFPCLVIRGISDYADSHKNDIWKSYAAAVAAAYAKELLQFVTPKDVDAEPTAQKILNTVHEDISSIKQNMAVLNTAVIEKRNLAILDWISPHDFSAAHNDILYQRMEGTCLWFLETEEMKNWFQNRGQTLFCPGIPGAGKTVMAATIIEHLESALTDDSKAVVAYIYCSYQPKTEQSIECMVQVLLRQVTAKNPKIPHNIQRLHDQYSQGSTRPPLKILLTELCESFRQYDRVFVVLDAVDEYYVSNYESHQILMSELARIQETTPINILMTSRFSNTHAIAKFPGSVQKEIRAQQQDIVLYLNARLPMFQTNVIGNVSLEKYIQSMVLRAADGMFLLARLHTEYLMMKPSIGFLKRALETLPRGQDRLTATYLRSMSDIDRQSDDVRDLARKALSWLSHSELALSSIELQHALATESGISDLDDDFLIDVDILHNLCAGLIVWDRATDVVRLIHHTTQDFLHTEGILQDPESQIALNCLTYMSFDTFLLGRCSNPETYADRHERYPLYAYCTHHWGNHARKSSCSKVKDVGLQFLADVGGLSAASQSMIGPRYKRGKALHSENILRHTTCRITAAHVCAAFGLTEWLRCLLEKGADANAKDSERNTPLTYAARAGHEDTARLLMPQVRHDVFSKDSALEDAAAQGHEASVKYFLSDCVSNGIDDRRKQKALNRAAKNGHISTIKLLLDHGAKAENREVDGGWLLGNSPLEEAISSGSIDAVCMLLSRDGAISADTNKNQDLVYRAVSDSNDKMVDLLVTRGADPDLPNTSGRTPLIKAVKKDAKGIVRLLLSKDVKVNIEDDTGWTPLLCAISNDDTEMVDTLLRKGADPNLKAKNWANRTPLNLAIARANVVLVRTLLLEGAHPNQPSGSLDNPPLSTAAKNGDEEVVRLLLQYGADVNLPNKARETPLFFAAKAKQFKLATFLLSEGAKHDIRNIVGNTVLFYAVQGLPTSFAVDLIRRGCDPNERNELEETPLFYAARAGCRTSLRLLLDNGVQADLKNKISETPLLQAATFLHSENSHEGYSAVIRLLLDNGADPNLVPDSNYPNLLFDIVQDSQLAAHWAKDDPEKLQQAREIWSELSRLSADVFAVFCAHLAGESEKDDTSWSARRAWKDGLETPLIWAALAGCTDLSQRLVNLGHDEMDASCSDSLIYQPAGFGYKSNLRLLVRNYEPEERGTIGKLAFLSAVEMGNLAILPILRRHSLSYISSTTRVGDSSLLVAARRGQIDLCRYLLDAGFDIHHKDDTGKNSLLLATIEGHCELIQILLQNGSQVDTEDNTNRTTLLWAVQLGNTTVAEILLQAGANPNCLDKDNRTPLLFSVINGDDMMVELLLRYGANPDFTNEAGESALSWAVAQTYDCIASMLLKGGATLVNNNINQSPLFWLIRPSLARIKNSFAVKRPSYNLSRKKQTANNIVSSITSFRLNGSSEFDADETVKKDVPTMLRLLISYGQDINIRAVDGKTCLARAAFAPNRDYATLFLQQGANPNIPNNIGETPLFLASRKLNADMVNLLGANGADPNQATLYGRTPLMTAAGSGALEVARALLKIVGIDKDIQDRFGRTAYSEAFERGHSHICTLLESEDVTIQLESPDSLRQAQSNWNCDICRITIFGGDEFYHCNLCQGGEFDVCNFCLRNGASCLDDAHAITRITATARATVTTTESTKKDPHIFVAERFASMFQAQISSLVGVYGGGGTRRITSPSVPTTSAPRKRLRIRRWKP
ncbi:hypothetical protein DTO271G3_5876 [Paecilomyces variotii]|nr:hypothetical protein DTO271G3_5876 [Paecilomyces variotii]